MNGKLLSPLTDPVFKRIFGQEKEILIELINAFIDLDEPVIDIEYLPQELLTDTSDGKVSIVDVRCIDSNKRHFIFEIQIIRQLFYEERVLYYAAKAYSRQLLKSRKYEDLQPVYLLSILDHTIDENSEEWLQRVSFINETNLARKIRGIHLIYLELEKCRKRINFTMKNKQDRWITFLTEPEKIMTMSTQEKHDYPNLVKAVELLDESNYTPGQLIAYDKYLDGIMTWNSTMVQSFDNGFDEGILKGKQEGREEGREEGVMLGTDQTIAILRELKIGKKEIDEIASEFNIPVQKIMELKSLL
jgi:predicted transposase/invertase (TIGR01784 family)